MNIKNKNKTKVFKIYNIILKKVHKKYIKKIEQSNK